MDEQLKATEALLDVGLSVPLRPVRFGKRKWVPRVTIYRPPLGGLLRILQLWLSLCTTIEQLDLMDNNERLRFKLTHGRTLSKIVALCVCSGFMGGKLFTPIVAWFFRWRCHEDTMLYVVSEFMRLQDTKSFMTIIKSVATINVVAPKMSQKTKRS